MAGSSGISFTRAPLLLAAALVLLSSSPAPEDEALVNGSFEAKPTKDEPVPGWLVHVGALNGASEPLSVAELDGKEKHKGKRSLHLAVTPETYAMQIVEQAVEARPGGRYRLSGYALSSGVRHEKNAKGIPQFDNSYLALFLFDGNGELVARDVKPVSRPDSGWQQLEIDLAAPETTRRAEVKLFLSVTGDVWFDDLELSIEGGKAVPAPALVFADDFEASAELSAAWLVEEGARNGGDTPASTTEIAGGAAAAGAGKGGGTAGAAGNPARGKDTVPAGAGGSARSLHLAGNTGTLLWNTVNRYFEAAPGDAFQLTASVRAEGVRQELNVNGVQQFPNLHARLVFLDAAGAPLGSAIFAHPGNGSFDWKPLEVKGAAPEGTVRGLIGFFLSMSGDVWIDDVTLTRQGGNVPAYGGWQTLATKNLVLRYPKDHPNASGMKAFGARAEEGLAAVAKALGVSLDAPEQRPITMFLYRDGEQGRTLTGRDLDFAEPERRAVHQRPNSTLTHELTHVVALSLGYARTGLLGEGLAVWCDGAGPDAHHDRAAALLRDGTLPAMDALLGDFRSQEQGYPAAGSFCGFVIETRGMDTFRRLYPLPKPADAAPAILGLTWSELDAEWRAFLAARQQG